APYRITGEGFYSYCLFYGADRGAIAAVFLRRCASLMKPLLYSNIALALFLAAAPALAASPGPVPAAATPPIAEPEDRPFPGTIQLSIDATDIDRKVVRVHEAIPATPGDLTLLYPKWLPGTHAPEG